MTSQQKLSADQLVDRIIELRIAEGAALERQDTHAQNRLSDRLDAAIRELLSQGEEGRTALERLLHHELPLVRLAAAAKVFDWSPERAVPVLEELLAWAYDQKDEQHPTLRPMVASFMLSNVEFFLAKYYGIRLRDVVPRVLGIEEDPRPWT